MGIAASLFFSSIDLENCLDWRVRPSDEQYETQQTRWNDLRDHLVDDLGQKSDCSIYSWLQGSYKFGTQVRPSAAGQEFDIDLGIYFTWAGKSEDGPHSPVEIKEFVQRSLEAYAEKNEPDSTNVGNPRDRCSRIHFEGDFHIDVPSYHLDTQRDYRALATAADRWEDSDPKAIYEWWKENLVEENRHRCRRVVRYLKMWAALKFDENSRPSSIFLTVVAAEALLTLDTSQLTGDDEYLKAIVEAIATRLSNSSIVSNPANTDENLNRLSDENFGSLRSKLETLKSICQRGCSSATKLEAADIWSEAFEHFFPIPTNEELAEDVQKAASGRALARIVFDPAVLIEARSGTQVFRGNNKIGPIPKGCNIHFTLANSHQLPVGATVNWMVRNTGADASTHNDLGHKVGEGLSTHETSAYRGDHSMDVTVKLGGVVIGTRRIPVSVSNLGAPLRNPPRPAWTKLRSRR